MPVLNCRSTVKKGIELNNLIDIYLQDIVIGMKSEWKNLTTEWRKINLDGLGMLRGWKKGGYRSGRWKPR